jgi:predicted DNA-binding protein with PD1-like motif
MDYRKFNGAYIVRLDAGDEIVECLKACCRENKIKLGTIIGIGTSNSAQVGILETATKEYHPKAYNGDMEITSLTGTITCMDGSVYLHIHANMALMDHTVIGGHLDYAVVSAVAEIIIQPIDGTVEREYSETVGVNLLQFK